MPTYLYKLPDGSLIERSFSMGLAPASIETELGLATRSYTAPYVSVPSATSNPDDVKIQQEVVDTARSIGMRELVPMRHQSPQQQLKDLKENRSKFKDSMQQSLEQSKSRLSHSRKPASRPTDRQISSFLEKQQQKEFNQRRLNL